MLTQLTVKDVALARSLELTFATGMTVITGETGAGKSIMLSALGLALGDRADSGAIATGADKAEVSACFLLEQQPEALAWLQHRELGDGDECVVRRLVSSDGRSRAFINGIPVTVRELRELGDRLIDIHSQHEHQSLLKRETHRRLLDEFGACAEVARKTADIATRHREVTDHLASLSADNEAQTARQQLLGYQIEELTQLDISVARIAELELDQRRLSSAETILTACSAAIDVCTENDETNAAGLITHAISQLRSVELPETAAIIGLLEESRIQLQEAAADMARLESTIEVDPERLRATENQLDQIYTTARKHRVEPEALSALLETLQAELETLTSTDEQIEQLQTEQKELEREYQQTASKLSAARAEAATKLVDRINVQLGDLGMGGARFEVELTLAEATRPNPHGRESIEFLVATNPGASPKPLNRVASGGELSRISLAIQVATADTSQVPTLVFDEVDVGIGGAVAEVVGTRLRELGSRAQIICVTHLAQVAAQGHQHLLVVKHAGTGDARTEISVLGEDERIQEIARMLGGARITDQSIAHANEMFEAAQEAPTD